MIKHYKFVYPDFTTLLLQSSLETRLHIQRPSPLQPFAPQWPGAEQLQLFIKRDDQLHAVISGNKWRKLSQQLTQYASLPDHIVSFGGGYSNHLHALGYLCWQLGITFSAMVRGDYRNHPTPMLVDLQRWQTQICYVSRLEYQQRSDPEYLQALAQRFATRFIIPEGGSNQAAVAGIGQIVDELHAQTAPLDVIAAPVASGATLAGLAHHCAQSGARPTSILGIGVLKGEGYLESLVQALLPQPCSNWHIDHTHCGRGYAKSDTELLEFCEQMQHQYAVPVEPVYSGKLFLGVKKKIAAGEFAPGTRLVLLHTGGLQGARN
ncbi:pyridoxal-phosphate dependent enzyme [Salinimonas marina]|uniref:Pyridoxal-phosphate dependent enzyme n=1 Tax=Salinimonas marina TaxID=2785918 RepID=A0A7S9HDI5_9ALTE|nr:pyridoxal-phosphate dependent enzyme [Salinimonas marina]QPG06245.1 pyridoxal-phosphate dependent enzyme [Salinimonas marina]